MSKQQTLFHHFASGTKTKSPRKENGNVTLQPVRGQEAINQDDVTENFDDDLLLAACQDWEETTLTHPANKSSIDRASKQDQAQQNVPGKTRLPSGQSPQIQPVPTATQLEDLPGFDASAGEIWIYPTNLPVRDYQYNIVQQALFRNTMVSLPTGLGKTLVAAVVMYNFYRWYPEGRVVFMAPTKPLVAQQIEACHNVMGIQQSDMAEMTGNMPPAERQKAWHKCRVFFLTPQVLMNDLSRRACPTQLVKCVVVDEAHKALGNHAYCQVVRELSKYSSEFRVLALSATPGSDLKAIQQVLTNLLISHIEIRSEDSIDIQRYVHERKVEKVVVPLDEELKAVRDQYLRILSVYVGRLTRCGALYNKDPASLTKFQILQSRDAFRQDPPPLVKSRGVVEGDFAICISLYHGFELLLQHGLRSLYSFLHSTVDGDKGFSRTRQELLRNAEFVQLMDALRDKFGRGEETDGLTNRSGLFSVPGTPRVKEVKPYVTSHPKMAKLQEIVLEHFRRFSANKESPSADRPSTSKHQPQPAAPQSTRVMIFAQYRDSVNEIAEMLNRHRPLLRCMGFVGQASAGKNSKGISQKEQLRVVKEFREGGYNTLVCTCVGEEGLDIGDVDLIVCYDAHKSPIRLVQRMGRTGRKRQGRIVMLVTEGKEAAIYDRSQYSKKGIVKALQGNARSLQLYPNSPRMVPRGLNPAPHKMFITVKAFMNKEAKRRSAVGASSETRMDSFLNKAKSTKKSSEFLSPEELAYWSANYKLDAAEKESLPSMPDRGRFITLRDKDKQHSRGGKSSHPEMSLSEWSPWQMSKQPVRLVEHSHRCHQFVELMEFIDLQNMTEGDDIYGLEMQTYLDHDDIIRPRKTGIENYCTKLPKDPSDDGDHLKKASKSKPQEPSLLDTVEETSLRSVGKKPGHERAKRKNRPMELMSSPSESNHSDDYLPDVFQDENANLVLPEVPEHSKTSTSAEANGMRSGARSKKEKANESKSSTADKPRKHKQKRKHLRPVMDSSDGDDDFTSNLRQERACGDMKTISLERDPKVASSELDSALDEAHGSPNHKGTDVIYDTPEPMDTDSDNFLIFKIPKKTSEPIPGNDLSSSLLNKTEDDLSFMFPTQSVFFPSSSKKDDPKPSEIRTGAGKSVIPPLPPSLASLDMLDDIDTTFNLSQHFQSESNHFGGQREPKNQPTILASCEGSFKVGDTPSVEKLQESQANESKVESLEEVSFGALKDVNGIVSDEQSKTFTNRNRSSHDGDEEIQIETTDNDELKKNQLKSLGEIEPHFDLNVDFTFISSDEEVEMSEQQDTNKDKRSSIEKPSNQDNDVEEIDLENVGDDNFESIFGTPQAFDVETPMVESTLTASVIPAVNLLQAFKLAGKETPCNISMAKSRKPLQSRVSKRPSSATPETPKSGLGARTKTSFAGRLYSDETNGPSCAGNEKFGSRRELDLEVPDASKIGLSSLEVGRGRVQQEEDPAETEKLRMEVLGSAEPKFDLGFDLDSLEEDGSGEEDDIVAPSPNMERQQEYINLSQVAIPKGQLGSSISRGTNRFQARISSTPVSKADSQLKSVPCTDFLSPIATDRKPVTERCPGFDAHPPNLRVNESESSQITPTKDKVTEPARRQGQMRKSLSLSKKSPQQLQTVKYCDVSSPSSNQVQQNVTEDALPHPARGTCEAEVGQSTNVRLTVLGKRKSAPVTNLADDSPIGVKRRMSEPAKASPIQSIVHSSPDTGVFSLTDARIQPDDLGEVETVEGEVIVLDEEDKREVEEPIKDQGRNGADPTDHPPVHNDENEELSQPIQRRKRRKAVALQSPMTPAFKTPVRPNTGGSTEKTTRSKPLVFSSDDDLESPLIRRPKKRRQIIMTPVIDEADEDFIDESSCKKDPLVVATRTSSEKTQQTAGKDLQMNRIKKQTKKNKIASSYARGFLEEDVVVSDGEEYSSDEEGSDLDNSLEGFINNASLLTQASQSVLRVDDMHAVYMQSVRSPAGGGILHPDRNRFKMVHLEAQQPVPEDMEIFSQVPVQDESYYENSFVVREGEEDGGRRRREQFDESIFENTINPDNIISARRRRRRNQGPSRAEQILREGRRKVLMSSSSTSTSNEETDEEQRRPDKKMQSRDKRRGQKVSGLGATHSVENPNSSGWLSTDKSSKQKSSSLVGPRRGPVNYPQVSPVKRTNVLHSTEDSVRTYTLDGEDESHVFNKEHKQGGSFPSQSQGSVIRHLLAGNAQQSNSCPNVVPNLKPVSGTNRPTSSISKTAEVASNGLTLAEKERAERLRRQEEKKREFMRKMEERKRQQQQQLHKHSQEQVQSQQQKDQLKPVVQHFQQQPHQLHQVSIKQQHQQLDAHQQQTLPQHQHLKTEIFAGRSSDSAAPGISEVGVKKIHQQAQNSSLEQHQHLQQQHLQQQQQQQKFKQTFEQQQQPLVKKNNVQQQKAEMYAGRASNSARASGREVQVKKMHPQAKSSSLELGTPPSSNASLAASAVSAPTHKLRGNTSTVIPAATMQGPRSPPMSPSSMRLIGKTTLAGSQDAANRGKPVILIDSKELSSSSHIVSTLTLKHNLNPLICQLSGCDYIVSARMGVEKKSMSDFGNGANKTKLIDRVRHLCELFDRPCIILEKDRIKPGDEKKPKQIIRTKYFDSTLAALSKTHIKVLYSDSLDDTARILADLVRIEMRKGEGLAPPTTRNSTQEQVFKFYQSLPRVNYATALSLMRAFPCVQQLINSTPEQLKKAANISHQRSAEICCFLQHQFDEQMISLSSGR